MAPIVSIIIPVYNRPVLVAEAIESVLAQTNPNWELIVVDDGSTDNTWDVLVDYARKDERIRIYQRDREPKGAPTCRNIGAGLARGKYLIFFDSDDIFTPWCLSDRVTFFSKNPELDISIFQVLEFNFRTGEFSLRIDSKPGDYIKRFVSFKNAWGTQAVIWKKESFIKLEGWDEGALSWQDGELHLRAILSDFTYKWGSLTPDVVYRVDDSINSISKDNWLAKKLSNRLDIYKRIESSLDPIDKDLLRSTFYKSFWSRCFHLKTKDLRFLVNKAFHLGFLNENEKKEFVGFFNYYQLIRFIPFVRRFFYKKQLMKAGVGNNIQKIKFDDQEKNDFFLKLQALDKETKEKFLSFFPEVFLSFFN